MIGAIAANPSAGVLIQGSGGIRKTRFAGRGKGKSGGYRVLVADLGPEYPAAAIAILSKGESEDFDKDEIASFAALIDDLKQEIR